MRLSGFTYIEVLLTVALMIFIGIMASPLYGNFLFGQEVSITTEELRASLLEARWRSMMGMEGSSWGVTIDEQKIVLFQGETYGMRDTRFDQIFQFHDRVRITGLNEIIFERRTGVPSVQPIIWLSLENSALGTETHIQVLRINEAGVVNLD